jgi:hypothetical protein
MFLGIQFLQDYCSSIAHISLDQSGQKDTKKKHPHTTCAFFGGFVSSSRVGFLFFQNLVVKKKGAVKSHSFVPNKLFCFGDIFYYIKLASTTTV